VIDLLVAGGGPAGLATAVYGARAGLDVVVVEQRRGPIDKACGEGLLPHAVRLLEGLGAQPEGRTLRGISYTDGTNRVDAPFRCGTGRGVRRTTLHTALFDAASAAGARIERGEVGAIHQDTTSVSAGGFRARYLAAADGLHSPIRRSLGLEHAGEVRRRWGIRRHIQIAPWTDNVEVHWAPGAEAYVTPVADDCVGVAILTSGRGRFDRHLDQFTVLKERLRGREHGQDRAAGPLRQRVKSRSAGRVLLVGDAAGYVDALTGEGIGLAFGGAELLVRCVANGATADYDRRWRRMSRRYRLITAALLGVSGCPQVRSRLVPAATALPGMFAEVVNALGR